MECRLIASRSNASWDSLLLRDKTNGTQVTDVIRPSRRLKVPAG
jgi:hypothetical protein